jgi:hypothetical protein
MTTARWPNIDVRLDMLEEAVGVMRALWSGDYVSHHGQHYSVENARIYTRTEQPQTHQRVVAVNLRDAGAVQRSQADRDRIIGVSLAAIPASRPAPALQRGRNIQYQLAITHQTLRQRSARAMATLHRPPAIRPAAANSRSRR